MRVAVGQEWELSRGNNNPDPLVLRVVELLDEGRYAVVRSFLRSEPDRVLDSSTMWSLSLIETGVLVAGPGALEARRRRERINEHTELLLYSARLVHPGPGATEVRFVGTEVVEIVAANEKVDRASAKAMLRDALASLGGTETWTRVNYGWYAGSRSEIMYVIPIDAVRPAAAA